MKNIYLLFFFTIGLIHTSFCQQEVFFKTYFSNAEAHLNSIDTTHDEGYVMCGRSSNTNGGDYLIIKIVSSGNEQWRRQNNLFTGLENDNGMFSIHENPDHSFFRKTNTGITII